MGQSNRRQPDPEKSPAEHSVAPRSFVSPNIRIAQSTVHGMGMFARAPIRQGEIVFIKGGHILRKEDVFSSDTISSYLPLDGEYFIGATNPEEEPGIKLFINHSCDPNCGIRGEITFVALRCIATHEEVTIDYATVDDEDYSFSCACGSPRCRKRVTGRDWKIPELQRRYRGFFARYLADKIREQ